MLTYIPVATRLTEAKERTYWLAKVSSRIICTTQFYAVYKGMESF